VTPSPNRLRERFDADPGDRAAFEGLEEAAFVAGDWSALIQLYEAHLAATGEQRTQAERARLLFRMAQAIEELGGDPARVVAVLRDAAALDPGFDLVTRKLREILASWNENAEQSHGATDPGERGRFVVLGAHVCADEVALLQHAAQHAHHAPCPVVVHGCPLAGIPDHRE
jgi:hypothetical protein